LNTELFIAKRIIAGGKKHNRFSQPIVSIAIAGIALGIAVMIVTMAIVTGFQKEIRNKVIGFGSHIQITNYDSNTSQEPNPISRERDFLETFKKEKGIRHIQVFAIKNGLIKTKTDNEGVLLKGIDKDYDWSFIKENLVAGNIFTANDSSLKNVVISKYHAGRLGLKLNDKLLIYFLTKKKSDSTGVTEYEQRVKDFIITGIYETGLEDFDKKVLICNIRPIQKLNYWDTTQVGGFEMLINNFKDLDKIGTYVYENIGQQLNSQTIKEINATVFSWLDLQDVNAIIVISLMVMVATINMISALLVLILERTNMIGILKALGSSNGSIRKIFLYNAAYLIGKGLLWGNIIGLGLCLIQKKFGIITLPKETYYVSVIPININLLHDLLLNLGTIVVCILMLIVPSFIVTKITPVKAIRFS
jgi:lipoprotein-releasing system permease protein